MRDHSDTVLRTFAKPAIEGLTIREEILTFLEGLKQAKALNKQAR